MVKNYFKVAWRNITRTPGYSMLNVFGLATGMAVALLIGLWVYYQFSYDRFLPGYQQVYNVQIKYNINGEIGVGKSTPLPLPDALKTDIPGIKYVAQTDWMGSHSLVVGEKKLYQGGAIAGSDFFKNTPIPFCERQC